VHVQLLSSGSQGNSLLVRAGKLHALVDAGLGAVALRARLHSARLPLRGLDHILVTHGHLDHARSAGTLAKQHDAELHAPERILDHRCLRRAKRMRAIRIGSEHEIDTGNGALLAYLPVLLPHDCDPTVAYRIDHGGRRLVVLTDMGRPDDDVGRALAGAHVLVLEFNHDAEMLASGPYPASLKRRVAGPRGHLSNEEAQEMLERLAGPGLHTLVLAHLSETNNAPERALAAARSTLQRLGLDSVRILIASQHEIGENLEV
jgi:phosphoribosyl 1,2-cyclic phosphodiesterase